MLDPYSAAAKWILVVVAILAVFGLFARYRWMSGELDRVRASEARLIGQMETFSKNAALASAIARKWQDAESRRAAGVDAATKEVYRARKPIPDVCRDSLGALRVAVDRLRSLRAERGAPAPGPNVLARSGAPGTGTN